MHSELLWSEGVLRAEGFLEALEGDAPIEEREDRVGPTWNHRHQFVRNVIASRPYSMEQKSAR